MNSNVSGSGADEEEVKKNIAIFAYKQRIFSGSQLLSASDFQTFF